MPNVLVVEDDDALRAMVLAALRREPLTVDSARDGVEALERIRNGRYAVVIIDLMMPRMNGFELIEALTAELPRPRPVVFVMTAYDDASFRDLDPDVVAGVLRKPFDVERLAEMVRDCALLFRDLRDGAEATARDEEQSEQAN